MPTVEQLYTLIGAKDGFIYDLQLQLSGLNQEYQKVVEQRDTLQEQVDKFNTPANDAKPSELTRENLMGETEADDFNATFKPH